jgi:hypothetical protein
MSSRGMYLWQARGVCLIGHFENPLWQGNAKTAQDVGYRCGHLCTLHNRLSVHPVAHHLSLIQSMTEFIPLSFWYDAPLISRDSDRRHDLWLVYRRGARPPSNIGQQPVGREWMSYPYPPETWATIGPGGHENTLGGDTDEWCGCVTHPRCQRRGSQLW